MEVGEQMSVGTSGRKGEERRKMNERAGEEKNIRSETHMSAVKFNVRSYPCDELSMVFSGLSMCLNDF